MRTTSEFPTQSSATSTPLLFGVRDLICWERSSGEREEEFKVWMLLFCMKGRDCREESFAEELSIRIMVEVGEES